MIVTLSLAYCFVQLSLYLFSSGHPLWMISIALAQQTQLILLHIPLILSKICEI